MESEYSQHKEGKLMELTDTKVRFQLIMSGENKHQEKQLNTKREEIP